MKRFRHKPTDSIRTASTQRLCGCLRGTVAGRACKRNRSDESAFTLVEMMIVVAIIGILASVILPSLDSAGAQSLQAVARVLAADLQLARSYAIQNNSEYSVTFDFANSEYEITHTGSGTHAVPENPMAALSEADGTYVVNLSQMGVAPGKTNPVQLGGVALRDSKSRETEIAFGPLGGTGPIRNEDTVIWLTETSSGPTRYVRLIVSWVTGQVWMDGPEIFDSSDTNQLFR